MEKRLFIAVFLSIAFLFGWGFLAPRFFPGYVKKPQAIQKAGTDKIASTPTTPAPAPSTPQTTPVPKPVQPAPAVPVVPSETRVIETVVEQPNYIARFSNRGAVLTSFVLKNYHEKNGRLVDLVRPRDRSNVDFPFALQSGNAKWNSAVNSTLYQVTDQKQGSKRVVTFNATDPEGQRIQKTYTFQGEPIFEFAIQSGRRDLPYRVMVGPGIRATEGEAKDTQFLITGNAVVQRDGEFDVLRRDKAAKLEVFPSPDFVGIEDNYFLTLLRPERAGEAIVTAVEFKETREKATVNRKDVYAGLNSVGGAVAGSAYFGAKEAEVLDRYGLNKTLKFGVFGVIARGLLIALKFIYQFTHNWGWAIVVLTFLIKVALYPLQHKSIVSMKKMQKLQPKMNAIKERYKKAKTDPDQRNKMNMEVMNLYKVEGISPMSGCFPILLQLPILWAFYNLLSAAIELRGAEFMLWIQDLSAKDPYYITPILMTVTMLIQQMTTPNTMDPVQRRMFLAMPIVMGWIFKEFPSGLVLYWLVQNILTIIQQLIMNRWWKDHPESLQNV